MVVQATPLAAVVPPSVTGRGYKLVGRKLIEHMTALDAPERVLKRTERSAYNIHLCVIIVLCSDLIIESLVKVGAAS